MTKINYNSEDLESHNGIAAVIKNKQGEILVQKHAKFGFFTIPVGKVKSDQDIIEGLKEELFDECDIKIDAFQEITSKTYNYSREGKDVEVHLHLFEIKKYSGEIKNKEPHKHKTQGFMTLEKIKKLPFLSDSTLLYLETLGIIRESKMPENIKELPLGLYQHFKGKKYEVIGVARHSETLEEYVVYKALYESEEFGKDALWIRPKKMFLEKVMHEGKEVERFKKIEQ